MSAKIPDTALFSPAIRDWMNVWEALRKLGYPADDIYLTIDEDRRLVCLVKRDGRACRITRGLWTGSDDELRTEYRHAAAWANQASQDELRALWDARDPKLAVEVAVSLMQCGMETVVR